MKNKPLCLLSCHGGSRHNSGAWDINYSRLFLYRDSNLLSSRVVIGPQDILALAQVHICTCSNFIVFLLTLNTSLSFGFLMLLPFTFSMAAKPSRDAPSLPYTVPADRTQHKRQWMGPLTWWHDWDFFPLSYQIEIRAGGPICSSMYTSPECDVNFRTNCSFFIARAGYINALKI